MLFYKRIEPKQITSFYFFLNVIPAPLLDSE